jgi:lipopolysaccharide export system permease protein
MLFDSTLRRELARSFGATLMVVLTVVLTLFLIRTLGEAALGRASADDVAMLLGFSALGHLPNILALSLFIATVATLTRLYRESEMTIWFASGLSLWHFARPVFRMAWPVLLVIAALALWVWPWVNTQVQQMQEQFQRRSDISRVAPGKFVPSGDGLSVFFIESSSQASAQANQVFVLSRHARGEAVTTAQSGQLEWRGDNRYLVLRQGQRHEIRPDSTEASLWSFEQAELLVNDHVPAVGPGLPPKARSTAVLWRDPNPAAQAELAWRLGLCLGAFNLLWAALAVSVTQPRRPNNWNLLVALLAYVVYYNLINLSQAWVGQGRMSLAQAMLGLHGSALLVLLMAVAWRSQPGLRSLRATLQACWPRAHWAGANKGAD